MCRIVLLLALSLLLSSCVSAYLYFSVAERQYFRGIIDGAEKSNVEKYNLVYLFNGDTVSALTRFMYVDNDYSFSSDRNLKLYYRLYCNARFASSEHGCPDVLKGIVNVDIFLKNNKSGNSYLLTKTKIDTEEFRVTLLLTQVYIGSNFEKYETRSSGNIDWSKMEQLVLKDENDTIYHYTVKYGDKRDKNDRHLNHSLDFDELVEVP